MKRYLIFAAVGPLLGGFWLLLTTTYQAGYWTDTSGGEVAKLFKVFFTTLQYSYLFGVLPALMIAAVDDILYHVKRIGPVLRVALVGAVAFILYGLVGLIPGTVSSWLTHKYAKEQPHPVTSP